MQRPAGSLYVIKGPRIFSRRSATLENFFSCLEKLFSCLDKIFSSRGKIFSSVAILFWKYVRPRECLSSWFMWGRQRQARTTMQGWKQGNLRTTENAVYEKERIPWERNAAPHTTFTCGRRCWTFCHTRLTITTEAYVFEADWPIKKINIYIFAENYKVGKSFLL
mgnify:CR=1 FL=1